MTAKLSFNKIKSVASMEYIKWLFNARMLLLIILYAFIYDYVVEELLKGAERMDGYIMLVEPFVAVTNSELLVMVIPVAFLVLMSDFPKTDGNTLFYIQRVGKINWLWGQLLFGVMAAVTYLLSIIGVSFVMIANRGFLKNYWSPVVTQYVKTFPNESKAKLPKLINSRLYNNLTPLQAFVLAVTLMLLYLILMEIWLLIGFSKGKRIMGMLVGYTIIAAGSSLVLLGIKWKWLFPTAHAISWLHFDKVLRFRKFGIGYSYLYFIAAILILIIVCLLGVRRYDFSKVTDMED